MSYTFTNVSLSFVGSPGYVGTGLAKLLSSLILQTTFIELAVTTAVAKKHAGYSVDWENSGGHSYSDKAAFLAKFASALHAKNRTISVAVTSPGSYRDLGLDQLQDMSTYSSSTNKLLIQSHMQEAGGPGRLVSKVS